MININENKRKKTLKQILKIRTKKIFVIVILTLNSIFSANIIQAQKQYIQLFVGFLTLEDQSVISYKVSFTELENQKIEGFSITNFEGKEKTKTIIKGQINKELTRISFSETSNVSTLSKAQINEFCFVNVVNAEIKDKNGIPIIIGDFIGKYLNDSICAKGKIYLVKNEEKIKGNNDSARKQKTLIENNLISENANENQLKSNQTLGINWSSEKIKIDLWDAAIIDGDSISIFLDDKIVLENYEIKSVKRTIEIAVEEGIHLIKVLALNEGTSPPNTVNFILSDNQKSHIVTTKLKKSESAQVKIIKTKTIKYK